MTYYLDSLPKGSTEIVKIEQPPESSVYDEITKDIVYFKIYFGLGNRGWNRIPIRLPYSLGAKVGVRERWIRDSNGNLHTINTNVEYGNPPQPVPMRLSAAGTPCHPSRSSG